MSPMFSALALSGSHFDSEQDSPHSQQPQRQHDHDPLLSTSIDSKNEVHAAAAALPIQQQRLHRTGSSLSQCLQRTSSFAVGSVNAPQSLPGGYIPPYSTSLTRSSSYLARTSTSSSLAQEIAESTSVQCTALAAADSAPTNIVPTINLQPPHQETAAPTTDPDLINLLEELAAPMRDTTEPTAPLPGVEPRRVGGPLLMNPLDRLHLRIIVDHSCVEVYTGTGEVLSTRIYRGKGIDKLDPGIDFVAFGGAATLESISAYEVDSAWGDAGITPRAAAAMAERQASFVHDKGRYFGGIEERSSGISVTKDSGGGSPIAADEADELFDDLLFHVA